MTGDDLTPGGRPRALQEGEPLTLANHPRAGDRIRRLKGWGALIAFSVAGLLAWRAGLPLPDTAVRALIAGVVGYLGVWVLALHVWKILIDAEHRAAVREAEQAQAQAGLHQEHYVPSGFGASGFDPAAETIDPHAEGPAGPQTGLLAEGV